MRRYPVLAAALGLALATTTAQAAQSLQGPYPIPEPRAARGPAAADCPTPPEPTQTMSLYSPYRLGDFSYSKIDPGAQAKIEAQTKALRDFTVQVLLQANRYAVTKGANVAAGRCALRLLDSWASANALRTMETHDAQFRRSLQLGALAMGYDQVSGLNQDDPAHARIRGWLGDQGRDLRAHYDQLSPIDPTRRNNHLYWAALAEASVAAATDDKAALRWASEAFQRGVCSIRPNGSLDLEAGRGAKARQYHLYAAEPLVMTAEILARNGQDPYAVCDGALHRLVRFATDAIDRPDAIERLSRTRQEPFFDPSGGIPKSRMAWIELYERRFPGRSAFASRVAKYRPYTSVEMGGAVTALLGL